MELLLFTALIVALILVARRRESPRQRFFVERLQWLEAAESQPFVGAEILPASSTAKRKTLREKHA